MAMNFEKLIEGLRVRGQEIAPPDPSPEIVEVYNILAGEGYEVAPIVHIDGKRKEVRFGVFETTKRPIYTDGSQMYYSPRRDPLADILVEIRRRNKFIFPNFVKHVPTNSRFALSLDEINTCVVPEAIITTPHLAEQLTKGGIVLGIPDQADFLPASQTHNLEAYRWEWVQGKLGFGNGVQCIVGGRDDDVYILSAIYGWYSGFRLDSLGFRLQAVSPPQQLPR